VEKPKKEDLLEKNTIIEYLKFLQEYSNDICSKKTIYRKHFRGVNKEIDRFIYLLNKNQIPDKTFIQDVTNLKFSCNFLRDLLVDYFFYQLGAALSSQYLRTFDKIKAGAQRQNQRLRDEMSILNNKINSILNNIHQYELTD
jgi:hypothetical protein